MKLSRFVLPAVYIFVLLILSYNLPFSALFKTLHSYDELFKIVERSNQRRTGEGKEYFSRLDPSSSTQFYQERKLQKDLLIAVGIISIQRSQDESKSHDSFGYLYQSASSIDKLLKNYGDGSVMNKSFAFICNVDLYPKKHKDAQHLSQYMPYVERYGNNSIGLDPNLMLPDSDILSYRSADHHKTVYEKETYDYVFCMNAAAHLKPKYILLVEEDAVPHNDFTRVLDYLFDFLLKDDSHHPVPLFIKFYFPSKWQGFSLRLTEICDLVSFSILGTAFYYLILYLYNLKYQQRISDNLNKMLLFGFVISLISCYIIGRQNLIELRRIFPQFYRMQSPEMCCTQAMLYPRSLVDSLSKFMISQALIAHTDLLIWDFADLEKLPSYQLEPNLFYHTGLHSTLPLKQKHPEEFIFSN